MGFHFGGIVFGGERDGGEGAYYGNEFCSLKVVPGFDNKIK